MCAVTAVMCCCAVQALRCVRMLAMMMTHDMRQTVLGSLHAYLGFWARYDVPQGSMKAYAGVW
jgi:hypothetical protein